MIDDLAEFGCPVLLFSGGEPCLRPDLVELMKYARARGLRVVLSTNGMLITPELAAQFASAGLAYAGVSVDGLKATHDRFRGVDGAFEMSLAGIRNAKAAGLKVGLRMTLNRGNWREIPAVFELMRRERIDRACFYHLVYSGRGSALMSEDLSHDECRQAVKTIVAETKAWFAAGGRPEILTVDNHADGPFVYLKQLRDDPARAAETLKLLQLNRGNSSGEGIGCVSWDGEVYADQFWRHRSFGNVRTKRFSEIWQGEEMRPLKDKRPFVKGRCATCRWLDVCGGNFRVRAEAATGDVWASDPACYLTDEEIGGGSGANGQDARSTWGGALGSNGQDARSTKGGGCNFGTGIFPVRAAAPCGTGVSPVRAVPILVEDPDALCHAGQRFFSHLSTTDVHERNLPHWAQDHTLVFITFRLADALPQEVVLKWQDERAEWLRTHPLPWTAAVEAEYMQEFPARFEKWLDAGNGSCVLAREDCRKIVIDALEYFNDGKMPETANGQDARSTTAPASPCGTGVSPVRPTSPSATRSPVRPRYRLHSFVVMPNHVHVLMELYDKTDLTKILHSWKSFTAKKINLALGKSGVVWQDEYYDNLMRSERHYAATVEYIRRNAKAAEEKRGQC